MYLDSITTFEQTVQHVFHTNTNTMLLNDDIMRSRIKKFSYDELSSNCQLILFLAKIR